MVVDDLAELLDAGEHSILRNVRVLRAIVADQLEDARGWREHFRDILDPGTVLSDCWIGDFEAFFLRVKRDADAHRFIVFGQNFATQQRGHQSGNPLLPVD